MEEITKDVSNITSGDSLKKLVVTGDSILKEKGTISIYGEKGKNGVLATKLKEILEAVTVENIIERYQGNGASMFYI